MPHESGRESTEPVDFVFLKAQTFGDDELERDLLRLFVAQVEKLVPAMPGLAADRQAETAHLLKGSARGIGAWPAANAADIYEATLGPGRPAAHAQLAAAFAAAVSAIARHLAERA